LASYAGILQADAYTGFNYLYHPERKPEPIAEAACWAHYLESVFMLSSGPATQQPPKRTGCGTLDKFCPHVAIGPRLGERRCKFRFGQRRALMRTLGIANGAMRNYPAARCTPRAAARLLAMAVMPGRRREAYALRDGIAPKVVEHSVFCPTSLRPGCLACSPQSRTAFLSRCRPRVLRPRPTHFAAPRSLCPAPFAGCAGAFERSEPPSRAWPQERRLRQPH
jgi:hypothetical protein